MSLANVSLRMESLYNRVSGLTMEQVLQECISVIAEYSINTATQKKHDSERSRFIFLTEHKNLMLADIVNSSKCRIRRIGHTDSEMKPAYDMLDCFYNMAMRGTDITDDNFQLGRFYELLGNCFGKLAVEAKTKVKDDSQVRKCMRVELDELYKKCGRFSDDTAKKVYEYIVS